MMFNVFVLDDEAGFFSALQAHLFARSCKAGITVNHLPPDEIDSAALRLLATLDIAAAADCALPVERHVLFIGLVPSPALIRRFERLSDADPAVWIHYLESRKYTFEKFYNRLSASDRDEMLFFMMDMFPKPEEREHNTESEKSPRKGRP